MMDLSSMDELTAPVTPQELDAWLRSTCVKEDETELEPVPVGNMKARPPLPKLSELGAVDDDGPYKPSYRRRSSLDMSGHSFGIDVRTALMLDDEVDQDTTIEEHCVRLVSDGSLDCEAADDFVSPLSTTQESVNRDAALSAEPAPLFFEFDRRHTGGTCASSDTVVRNNFARTVSDREDYARRDSSGSYHSQGSQAFSRSASCPGNQQNCSPPPRLYHSQSMPGRPARAPRDFNPFLTAMEKSQESQEFIHSEAGDAYHSSRSIGLMRRTSRSRELLLSVMSSSVSNQASQGGSFGRRSSPVVGPATPTPARENPRRDCYSAPASRRSSMEVSRRSSFLQNGRRESGAGSWRQRDARNAMLRSIMDDEEDAMREDLIRIGQKAARRMSWKGQVRMDPMEAHFNYLASGMMAKYKMESYPAAVPLISPAPRGFVDQADAVQAELRRIALEQMMEMGGGRATAA